MVLKSFSKIQSVSFASAVTRILNQHNDSLFNATTNSLKNGLVPYFCVVDSLLSAHFPDET